MAVSVKRKLPVHPSFLLLFGWFILMRDLAGFFIFVGVVLTHELGHYFVAKKLGYRLDSFFLAPYGVSLNYKESVFEAGDEVKIAIAGPLVNFSLAFVAIAFWWIFPATYFFTQTFVTQSILLGLFNLLPCYPLDGGRIVVGLLSGKMERKKSVALVTTLNFVFSFLCFVCFVISCIVSFNPTFALATCFLLAGAVQGKREGRYALATVFKKKNKNFSKPLVLTVNSSVTLGEVLKKIQVNKFTIFYCIFANGKVRILDEQTLLDFALVFSYTATLEEIFSSNFLRGKV